MLILHAPMMVCKLLSKCQLRCKVMRVCTQSPWLPDSGCSGHNLEDRRLCPAQRPEAALDSELHQLTHPSEGKDSLTTALQQPGAQCGCG